MRNVNNFLSIETEDSVDKLIKENDLFKKLNFEENQKQSKNKQKINQRAKGKIQENSNKLNLIDINDNEEENVQNIKNTNIKKIKEIKQTMNQNPNKDFLSKISKFEKDVLHLNKTPKNEEIQKLNYSTNINKTKKNTNFNQNEKLNKTHFIKSDYGNNNIRQFN